jgi:charged multivesicular body protein 6
LVVEQETLLAKTLLQKGNKVAALLALKKKKYQENLLTMTENQLLTLEELTSAIEFALVEAQVVKGLAAGNATLKALQAETSLEAVQNLMDDTADAISFQNEIDLALSSQLSEADHQEIEAELDLIIKTMVILYFNLLEY